MSNDVLAAPVAGSAGEFRSESEWRALMADFERWDGSQASFCDARGMSRKTFQVWRCRLGLTARGRRGKPGADIGVVHEAGAEDMGEEGRRRVAGNRDCCCHDAASVVPMMESDGGAPSPGHPAAAPRFRSNSPPRGVTARRGRVCD